MSESGTPATGRPPATAPIPAVDSDTEGADDWCGDNDSPSAQDPLSVSGLDPDSPEGAAILRLFRDCRFREHRSITEVLENWFRAIGIDPTRHPGDVAADLRRQRPRPESDRDTPPRGYREFRHDLWVRADCGSCGGNGELIVPADDQDTPSESEQPPMYYPQPCDCLWAPPTHRPVNPDTIEGAAITRLFAMVKSVEHADGGWPGGDVINQLLTWFPSVGINPADDPSTAIRTLRRLVGSPPDPGHPF